MLEIDFLNVGKGNCTVIKFPSGKIAIVDIDNSLIDDEDDILQNPIEFIDNKYPNKNIFRFILSHPDMDHMSGLNELAESRYIVNFWDTDHDKVLDPSDDSFGIYDPEDWARYQMLRSSQKDPKSLFLYRDALNDYWAQDGIQILSPSTGLVKLSKETAEGNADKYNHLSYVLRIEHEGIVTILGGDATKAAWEEIYEHYKEQDKFNLLKADVFLAPHHGSPNNVFEEAFDYINPDFVVVSVHRGKDYDYSYYSSLATNRVYSTKYHGNISLRISANEKNIYPERSQ